MKLKHFFLALFGLVLLSALLVSSGHATAYASGLVVNTLVDENDHSCGDGDCSLRDAIEVAAAGETITFDVTGTLTLVLDQLTIEQDLTISGPGADNLTLNGDYKSRLFKIKPGVTAALTGLRLMNGQTTDPDDSLEGGAAIRNEGALTVTGVVITGNWTANGGGISNASTLTVLDSSFSLNFAAEGGGIFNTGTAEIVHSSFSENLPMLQTPGYGGGIRNKGTLTVRDSSFEDHGIDQAKWDNGGGISNTAALSVIDSHFSGNHSYDGGGIFNSGTADIVGSTFTGNWNHLSTTDQGAGISNTGILMVTDSTFDGNNADEGAGILNAGTADVTSSTFVSNSSIGQFGGRGSGISNNGTLTVANSTFLDNAAFAGSKLNHGIGDSIANAGTFSAVNITISHKLDGKFESGSVHNENQPGATATLKNTIFDNAGCTGVVTDGGGNLRWTFSDASCPGTYGDPKLAPLADNGGPTQTMALGENSAALEHGNPANCPALDQRGAPRPDPAATPCDSGAFESALRPTVITWEDFDPHVQYGGWVGEEYTDSRGTDRLSRTQGDSFVYDFSGRHVVWYTRRGPDMGIAEVKIDGVSRGLVDLYNSSAEWQFKASYRNLPRGEHTLVVNVTGEHNPAASDSNVALDSIRIKSTVPDTANDIKYSKWVGVKNESASAGSYRSSKVRNAVARLAFSGTRIEWLTARGPAYGKAVVSIDGVEVDRVDLYAPDPVWQVSIPFAGLSDGDHTIEVRVLGKKNDASSGKAVIVDAFRQPVELP